METLELMRAYVAKDAPGWAEFRAAMWIAAIRASRYVVQQMGPDWCHGKVAKDERFAAFVAARLYRDAAELAWDQCDEDLGCSSATEAMIDNLAQIVQQFADEDQAERDKAMTE